MVGQANGRYYALSATTAENQILILFRFEIICGNRVYASDERLAEDYEESVVKVASDLSFKRKLFEKDFYESIANGYFEIKLE